MFCCLSFSRTSVSVLVFLGLIVGSTPAMSEQQITTDPADDGNPSWSPDGTMIAFDSDRSGNYDIWVIPAIGGEATQITTDPADDRSPTWSPNGTEIAFSRSSGIWAIPNAGGVPRQIASMGENPAWSPDGSQIAFDERWEFISVTSASDGGEPVSITCPDGGACFYGCQHAEWSPDGSHIVFVYDNGVDLRCRIQVVVMGLYDGNDHLVTCGGGQGVSWSSLGVIAFGMSESIWTAGSGPFDRTQVTSGVFPSWSPDGRQIAYVRNGDIWVIDWDGEVSVEVTSWGRIKSKYR